MRLPLTLYLIALAARALTGLLHPEPAYPDATYYVAVARSLAAGQGLTVDFIWNFVEVGGRLPADPALPIPSNAHWLPLASLVQVPFLLLLGTSPLVSLVPFALVGAAAAPLAWAIARDAGLSRYQAIAAGLLAAAPGGVTPFLGQPDNFALFMPLGALALWLCARGLGGDIRAFVLGGLVVGLASLARNDGILLGIPFAVGWLRQWWTTRDGPPGAPAAGGRPRPLPIGAAVGCALLFLLVMAPWFVRQVAVFGSIAPSASSGRILWITSYPQLFSVSGDPSLGSFLAQGLGPLLESRLIGLGSAFVILGAIPFLFFLDPFVLWAAWSRRRSGLFGPWFVYGAVLLLLSGLLFAVHVPYGTFLHSAVALVPHGYVLAIEGIALGVAWASRYRRHWEVRRATWTFTALAVATVWAAGALATWKIDTEWNAEAERRRSAAAALLTQASEGDRIMSADPGAYRYLTGLGGVLTPEDPLPVVERVAAAYRIEWLVIETAHTVRSLARLYVGAVPTPPWLVPVAEADRATAPAHATLPAWRIYAVCLDPGDPRPACAAAGP